MNDIGIDAKGAIANRIKYANVALGGGKLNIRY